FVPLRRPPRATPLPYTTLFRSERPVPQGPCGVVPRTVREDDIPGEDIRSIPVGAVPVDELATALAAHHGGAPLDEPFAVVAVPGDRKSTRLNSSHVSISYAVFC